MLGLWNKEWYKQSERQAPQQAECWGKSTREGDRSGVGRHERMKRGNGMKDRDERSRGIEIRIADVFDIIKPTTPFKLMKHNTVLWKRNWSDSSGNSLAKAEASRWVCKNRRRMKSSYKIPRIVVYYESMKRKVKTRPLYECRCDERLRWDVWECDGWVCVLEMIGAPSIFKLIRKAAALARARPTLLPVVSTGCFILFYSE